MTALRRFTAALALLCLLGAACGCSAESVHAEIYVDQRVNKNWPVAMEVVAVSGEDFLAELVEMTARDWFTRRKSWLADNRRVASSWTWELVPGQVVREIVLEVESADRLVIFADYRTEGVHRESIPVTHFILRLGKTTLDVETL